MSQIFNAGSFAMPAGNFSFSATGLAGGGHTILSSPSTDGSWPLLLGIDVVDQALLENDHATVSVNDPVLSAGGFLMHAFVYATSQGTFPWRGTLLIRPDMSIVLDALVGTWSYVIWGLSVTPQSDVP